MNHTKALGIATRLLGELSPDCTRIDIAGSVRRNKTEVHDIDIVCMPRLEYVNVDLFGQTTAPVVPLYSRLHDMQKSGDLVRVKGKERYFQFQTPEGIALELYCVLPPAQWGTIFAIRTGPAEFGHWLVTPRRQGGAMPSNAIMRNGGVYVNGRLIPMPEEIDFFNFLAVGMMKPQHRHPLWKNLYTTCQNQAGL